MKEAVSNERKLWRIIQEMESVSRRIIFASAPDTRRRKRLSKKVLCLYKVHFLTDTTDTFSHLTGWLLRCHAQMVIDRTFVVRGASELGCRPISRNQRRDLRNFTSPAQRVDFRPSGANWVSPSRSPSAPNMPRK
jgi:hypothetical protein